MNQITFSTKQMQYIAFANCRWNWKLGAVRSGKSFVDTQYVIPSRILERRGTPGLNVIIGVSKSTIERNVLQPMRETYGIDFISTINSNNIAKIFGEEVYCLGGEKISQVAKIQGASIKYCYGDEVAKWNQEVFEMLKSRLDKPNSCFDGALNPESPTHYLKSFIEDEGINAYVQHYTLFDNPHLPKEFVEALCKEYEGTIYYQRYILGLWCRAEGTIYKKYADNPSTFRVDDDWLKENQLIMINVGIDYSLGGTKSDNTFVAVGFTKGWQQVVALESWKFKGDTNPEELERKFIDFILYLSDRYRDYLDTYHRAFNCYCDSADGILINGFKRQAIINKLPANLQAANKMQIHERIRLVLRLIGVDRFKVHNNANTVNDALIGAVWSDKTGHEDERLDNGTSDIDTLDAMEYAIEVYHSNLEATLERR